MLSLVIAQYFKLKTVRDVILLSCIWKPRDQLHLIRQLSYNHGISAMFSCDPEILSHVANSRFTGVVYFQEQDDNILKQTKLEYFSHWYKWLVIGQELSKSVSAIRYDADMVFIDSNQINDRNKKIYMDDVFVHPTQGATRYPWAVWTETEGVKITNDSDRRKRRLNLKKFPLKIITPVGHYHECKYNGSFTDYLKEDIAPQIDSGLRCAYILSIYIFEMINASELLLETHYWSSTTNNNSMLRMVQDGLADIGAGYLRCLSDRIENLDYIMPIWPFRVGFTYLSERESSSNMYMAPFTSSVWWCCLTFVIVLALMQRITAKRPEEKEGAFIGVLATWLQQDAGTVPEGPSGRWSFLVMSVSAMLVYAYYTSAIVSALMSTGRGGPDTLRALADSKYAIASEDYDYMRYLFWNVDTNWTELEYLKKKKMTTKLYVDIKRGVQLIRDGSTAYHTEFNQIYPHFKTFSDDQLCKLSYLDTIPEQPNWTTATKRSQFSNIFRSSGAWLRETGLVYREVHRLRMKPPPCRASLLAERVKFGDVTPLLGLTASGAILSLVVLGLEILYAKMKNRNTRGLGKRGIADGGMAEVSVEELEYLE